MSAATPTARFRTTLNQAEGKKATGVIVPPEIIDELEAGTRPPVRVTVNGHTYRTTIGVMGGRSMISVSAAIREATGLAAGDDLEVELVVDDSPRDLDVPDDLAAGRGPVPRGQEAVTTPPCPRGAPTPTDSLRRKRHVGTDGLPARRDTAAPGSRGRLSDCEYGPAGRRDRRGLVSVTSAC